MKVVPGNIAGVPAKVPLDAVVTTGITLTIMIAIASVADVDFAMQYRISRFRDAHDYYIRFFKFFVARVEIKKEFNEVTTRDIKIPKIANVSLTTEIIVIFIAMGLIF